MRLIFSRTTMMCAGLAGILLAGCTSNDLYNPEAVREKAEQAFGMTIDPNQDWNMLAAIRGNVSIKEDALSNYTIKIYTADPLNGKNRAALLAEQTVATDAQGNASASLNFDLPSYLQYVYVARVDDHGRRLVKTAKVSDGTVKVGFGTSVAGTRAMETGELPTMECPYTKEEVNDLIANGYDIAKGLKGENGYGSVTDIKNVTEIEKITLSSDTHTWVISEDFSGTLNPNFNSQWGTYDKYAGLGEWEQHSFTQETTTPHDFKIVITEGATWSMNAESSQIGDVDIIVAAGGTLEINNKIYMSNSARIVVMPGGKITDKTTDGYSIDHNSGNAEIYNAGDIDIRSIIINSALFYNAPNATVKMEKISFQNDDCVFTNWGKTEAGIITGNGNQGTINNGCLLRSDDEIMVKYLNQAANTSIECKRIVVWSVTLRENSILRSEKLHLNGAGANLQYVGTESGDALVSTLEVEDLNNGGLTIGQHIYFEVNTYNDGGLSEDPVASNYSGSFKYVIDQALEASGGHGRALVGEAPIGIPGNNETDLSKADCTGTGNTPKNQGGDDGDDDLQYYSYAFEDLDYNGGDYDMNDVVLRCSAVQDGKITVKLVAAGASKNLFVYFKNQQLFGGEVHQAFGVEAGKLINTGAGPSAGVLTETIEVGNEFSYLTDGDFYIKDEAGRESHIPAFQSGFKAGDAPYAILVPSDWRYPKETVRIETAYPGFKAWAADAKQSGDWYNDYDASKVY